jgi:hypothetical protein
MTDQGFSTDAGGGPGREPSGRWRWVKMVLIIIAVLALVIVAVMLVVGGHGGGPSRHGLLIHLGT